MQFINESVNVESLPKLEEVPLRPVHPAYLKILRLEWMITALILSLIAAALIYFLPGLTRGWGWAILAGAGLLLLAFYRLLLEKSFPYLSFAVREKDILLQKGWITRSVKASPFNRIQNCSVQSGPLERQKGLASLIIFTAGSSSADMKIPGLLQEEAEKLRHYILEKIHTEAHEGI